MTDLPETGTDPGNGRKALNPHKCIIALALSVCIGLILLEVVTAGTWNGDNASTTLFNIRSAAGITCVLYYYAWRFREIRKARKEKAAAKDSPGDD